MLSKKIITKYNRANTLAVVSSYPPQGTTYGDGVGGVASFAKNTITSLQQYNKQKIVVFAEILNQPEIYEEGNVLVIRCWKRNSYKLYFQLMANITKFTQIKKYLIEFEFALYGDFFVAGVFPLFLMWLRIWGKQVNLVVHQVITDLSSLSGHLGWDKKNWLTQFFSFGIRHFYKLLGLTASRLVVLEKEFERRFIKLGIATQKITTISHGVDCKLRSINKELARKQLGLPQRNKVVLVFGFLTWYKGTDLAVKALHQIYEQEPNSKISLVIAGGESVTQSGKKHYQRFIQRLYRNAVKNPRVVITGFVKEKQLRSYFSAADLVILPYRSFMSSSGVLSLALSFAKPFILSTPLKEWFKNGEQEYMGQASFFRPDKYALAQQILDTVINNKRMQNLENMSKLIKEQRNYQNIATKYDQLINWGTIPVSHLNLATLPVKK